MALPRMTLKMLLPFEVLSERTGVTRIVAETRDGSFGLLPHRLDCAAALAPGILTFETDGEGEVVMAVDEGVLVKTGLDVVVSVRRALSGSNLEHLEQLVDEEYLSVDEAEQNMRMVMAKLETGFLRRFASFQNE
jgi:F-type H+-transporting ATPase subunit epsilon